MNRWFILFMLMLTAASLIAEEAAPPVMWNIVSQNTFMTFFSISTLVDAHQSGAYDDATALSIIDQYLTLNIACVESFTALYNDETLLEADRKTYAKLRLVHMMMNEELAAYGRSIREGNKDQLNIYKAKHDEAWKLIHDIFSSMFTAPQE